MTTKQLLEILIKLLKFPNATVCRHYVVLEFLNKMQTTTLITPELVRAVIEARDDDAIKYLHDIFPVDTPM